MKPFDERFAEKVREVFDRHDEPFDPTAWASMQARLRVSRKARVFALLTVVSKAAAVLLLLGGMTWLTMLTFFPDKPDIAERMLADDSPDITGLSDHISDQDDDKQVVDETVVTSYSRDAVSPELFTGEIPAEAPYKEAPYTGTPSTEIHFSGVPPTGAAYAEGAGDSDSLRDETVAGVSPDEGLEDIVAHIDENGEGMVLEEESGKHMLPADTILIEPEAMAQIDSTATSDTISLVGITTGPSYEYSKPDRYPTRDVLSDQPVNGTAVSSVGRLNWSVMAGSMLTYAEQQLASGLGFSGGVMSEYRASTLFGVSSGVALAYQQFEVDGMPLRQKLSRTDYFYLPDQFSARTVGNQSYELLALDIPLNVHYYFREVTRSQWYVSAGFSSLLYLQQRVSGTEIAYIEADYYDAALGSNRTINYASEVQTESNYDAFTRFDFARLLNLSVGYEIKQQKSVTIIEPFIKYPLGTISSRNIKMGMGGVRLRLQFGH